MSGTTRRVEVISWRDENKMADCITVVLPDEAVEELGTRRFLRLKQVLDQLQGQLQDLFNEEAPSRG